jgi:hypothetical protein
VEITVALAPPPDSSFGLRPAVWNPPPGIPALNPDGSMLTGSWLPRPGWLSPPPSDSFCVIC